MRHQEHPSECWGGSVARLIDEVERLGGEAARLGLADAADLLRITSRLAADAAWGRPQPTGARLTPGGGG